MIEHKTVLAIIPARAGSKGVPGKNNRIMMGRPLLEWTFQQAALSSFLDRIILSSDDPKTIETAKSLGCEVPFTRPDKLARDDTSSMAVIRHAVSNLDEKYDYVALLQLTSPLRTIKDIDGCVKTMISKKAPACVSVVEVDKSPYWMYEVGAGFKMKPVIKASSFPLRRQDLSKVYALNGAVYVAQCDWLLETGSFLSEETVAWIMPKERSMDIDTEIDFMVLEALAGSLE